MLKFCFGLILLALAPAAQEPSTQVSGVVTFTGTPKLRLLNASIDRMKHGVPPRGDKDVYDRDVIVGEKGQLANVLVRVKGTVRGEFPPPKEATEIDATGYFFEPRVLGIQAGQPVRFKNSGLTNVNVRTCMTRNREFNVGIARGSSHDVVLERPEIAIEVQHPCCPWQVVWIHVIEHPFFAVTGADGKFQIKGLPAGTYELEAWHENFGVRTTTVTIDGKGALTRDFSFEGK